LSDGGIGDVGSPVTGAGFLSPHSEIRTIAEDENEPVRSSPYKEYRSIPTDRSAVIEMRTVDGSTITQEPCAGDQTTPVVTTPDTDTVRNHSSTTDVQQTPSTGDVIDGYATLPFNAVDDNDRTGSAIWKDDKQIE